MASPPIEVEEWDSCFEISDTGQTIPELLAIMKSSFVKKEISSIERILVAREAKMKKDNDLLVARVAEMRKEIQSLKKENDSWKKRKTAGDSNTGEAMPSSSRKLQDICTTVEQQGPEGAPLIPIIIIDSDSGESGPADVAAANRFDKSSSSSSSSSDDSSVSLYVPVDPGIFFPFSSKNIAK